jgi:P-type Cu+ transporter
MTCASCAARVEKKLNKLPGVAASVNYATEKATITGAADPAALIGAVEAAGYTATVVTDERPPQAQDEYRTLLVRVVVTAALNIPILLLSLFMSVGVDEWRWVALACATPVVTWGAWPFHRATVVNARHGASTMDTLVSIGITTAYLWSAWAIVLGRGEIYLEVASAISLFLLLGR